MHRRLRLLRIPTLVTLCAALILLTPIVVVACPTCKEGLASDPEHAAMVRGYFWSIVFMMSMPFVILASLSSYFYFEIRRARRRLVVAQG